MYMCDYCGVELPFEKCYAGTTGGKIFTGHKHCMILMNDLGKKERQMDIFDYLKEWRHA